MNDLKFLMVNLLENVERLVSYGDFTKSLKLIGLYMTRNISQTLKDRLNFEKDRIRRLNEDYTYSLDWVFANSEFQYDLYPKKKCLRHAPYYNQNGEIECFDRPVFKNEYEVIKEIIEIEEIK